MNMTHFQVLNPAGLHVACAHVVLSQSGAAVLKARIIQGSVPHFSPSGHISLHVLDWFGREQIKPIVPCEWLKTAERRLALCCNPYPTGFGDRWLLCRPDGVACFAAASPEIARLHFYFLTGSLKLA